MSTPYAVTGRRRCVEPTAGQGRSLENRFDLAHRLLGLLDVADQGVQMIAENV
jgi:hypothetical protein